MLHLWPILNGLKKFVAVISLISEGSKTLTNSAPHRNSVLTPKAEFTPTEVILIKAHYARYIANKASDRPIYRNLDELVIGLNKNLGLNKSKYAYQKVWKAK